MANSLILMDSVVVQSRALPVVTLSYAW